MWWRSKSQHLVLGGWKIGIPAAFLYCRTYLFGTAALRALRMQCFTRPAHIQILEKIICF
jgi:hypothetical protein